MMEPNKVISVEFPNQCPNCKVNKVDEEGYDSELGTLALEQNQTMDVVYVICKNCGYIRIFRQV